MHLHTKPCLLSFHTHTPIHPNGGIRKGLPSAVIAPLSQLCLPFPFSAMDKLLALLFLLTFFIFSKDVRVKAGFKGSGHASLTLSDGTQDQLAYHHQDHRDGWLSGQKGIFCMSLPACYDFTYFIGTHSTIAAG